jgi:hypothetical protein
MHGKSNLISDGDRPICSLLGRVPPGISDGSSCDMTRLFKDTNLHIESEKFESANFITPQKKPGFLRLDSTGDEQCGMMPPQNQNRSVTGGVQYITQTMQQQHPNRCDRSPTPTKCGNRRFPVGHSSPNSGHPGHRQSRNRGCHPGNSLLSNVSGYNYQNCSPHHPQQRNTDHSQKGYPFYQFNNPFAYPPNNATMMPLGTSRFRAPMYGYAANVPYSYHPPRPFVQGPVYPSLFHQVCQFMPGSDARYAQNVYQNYRSQDHCARPRPRERSRKRRAKKHCRDSDVGKLAESLQKVSVKQGEKSQGLKRTPCSLSMINLDDEGVSPLNDEGCDFGDEIRQQNVEIDPVSGSCEECVKISTDGSVNSTCTSECAFVSADISDEISTQSANQCPTNLDNSVSQVIPGQSANLVSSDPVTHNVKYNAEVIREQSVPSDGDNVDSGFYDQTTQSGPVENCCDDKNGKLKDAGLPSEHLELAGFEIVPEKLSNELENNSSPTTGSCAKSDFVIIEHVDNDEENGFICTYNMEIYETDDKSDKSVSRDSTKLSDVAHFSVHVTELEHFNKDSSHCQKSDDDVRTVDSQDEPTCRSSSPPQGQNGATSALGVKQKKKSRPSAKKRKRMKQKKGIINVSICDISEKSIKNNSDSEVCDEDSAEADITNSPTRGRFRTVSFIVGSDSDSDDFDVEFVQSPRHSPPKSFPKLQFNLFNTDSEDEEASGSDSDFESDENVTDWNQDVLLDSFCIKDPYSPFSFQLQCTSVPVKKCASSPPNAFAFDVTIKRSLDPNRRRVSILGTECCVGGNHKCSML